MSEFTLLDYRKTLVDLASKGAFRKVMMRIPGMESVLEEFDEQETQVYLTSMIGVIDSMTHNELVSPEIINTERSERIARGSGTTRESVSELLRSFRDQKNLRAQLRNGLAINTLAPGRSLS